MTSPRKRNQIEKLNFREELATYYNNEYEEGEEYDDIMYNEEEDNYDEDYYNDYYDAYDDDVYYGDGEYDKYYYGPYIYNPYYDLDDYDLDEISYPIYKPGNHLKDSQNRVFLVTEDYKLVDILTGKYTDIHLLDGIEIIL